MRNIVFGVYIGVPLVWETTISESDVKKAGIGCTLSCSHEYFPHKKLFVYDSWAGEQDSTLNLNP